MGRNGCSLAALTAAVLVAWPVETRGQGGLSVNRGAVKVEFFVMSQCPYGVQVENGIKEALDKLGRDVEFTLDYVGEVKDGALSSMHGPDEVAGDMVQLCVAEHAPETLMPFIACQNRNPGDVARNWEACSREVQGPAREIRNCFEGTQGARLVADSFARAAARGATSSPTMFIANKRYKGPRRGADFLRAICAEYLGSKPSACQSISEAPR